MVIKKTPMKMAKVSKGWVQMKSRVSVRLLQSRIRILIQILLRIILLHVHLS